MAKTPTTTTIDERLIDKASTALGKLLAYMEEQRHISGLNGSSKALAEIIIGNVTSVLASGGTAALFDGFLVAHRESV